jgi:hypothetical protein
MLLLKIIFIVGLITIGGVIIDAIIVTSCYGPLGQAEGFEFVNPVWWYRNYPVNLFGAAMCALGFTILCPVMAICYWFYKLCTVGRR